MARILIIDDDPNMRQILGKRLESAGYEVVLAADGLQGVQLAREARADLVITDIYMPGQDGIATILELRLHFPRVPMIAMSGHDLAGPMLSVAQQLGAVGVLQKPFDCDEMLALVRKALEAK